MSTRIEAKISVRSADYTFSLEGSQGYVKVTYYGYCQPATNILLDEMSKAKDLRDSLSVYLDKATKINAL